MKLKIKLLAPTLALIMSWNSLTIPVYANSNSNFSITETTEDSINDIYQEEQQAMIAPTINTIMYYITYYWPNVHSFLLRYNPQPVLLPLSEKIRLLRTYWKAFINSFKPIDAYSISEEY